MKKDIHPSFEKATITCACGNVIETRSTKGDLKVEITTHSVRISGKTKYEDEEYSVNYEAPIAKEIISNINLKDTKPTWQLSEDRKKYTKI